MRRGRGETEVRKGGRKRKKKQRKGRKWEGRKEGTEEERKEKGEMNRYFNVKEYVNTRENVYFQHRMGMMAPQNYHLLHGLIYTKIW